jgi:hypothetical protein
MENGSKRVSVIDCVWGEAKQHWLPATGKIQLKDDEGGGEAGKAARGQACTVYKHFEPLALGHFGKPWPLLPVLWYTKESLASVGGGLISAGACGQLN